MDEAAKLAALVRRIAQSLVVVADDGLGDQSSEVVVIVPAHTLNGNSDVGSRDRVVSYADLRANEVRLLLGQEVSRILRGGSGKAGEVLLSKFDELLVGDTASSNENHAIGCVVGLDVASKLGPGDITDVLAGAENGAAQRLVLIGSGV